MPSSDQFPGGTKRPLTGNLGSHTHSQGDYMDTHERIANAQVATSNDYPRCLITTSLSKTNELGRIAAFIRLSCAT